MYVVTRRKGVQNVRKVYVQGESRSEYTISTSCRWNSFCDAGVLVMLLSGYAVIKIRQTFEVWWGSGLKLCELEPGGIYLNPRVVPVHRVPRIPYFGFYYYISPSSGAMPVGLLLK